jgi:hypothetical protein
MELPAGAAPMTESLSALKRKARGLSPSLEKRRSSRAAAVFLLAVVGAGGALALEAPTLQRVSELRLLPPAPQVSARPSPEEIQAELDMKLRIVHERHPGVLDVALNTGQYVATLLLNAEGRIERSSARQMEGLDISAVMREAQSETAGTRVSLATVPKGKPLPGGRVTGSTVMLVSAVLPAGYDPSRAETRVHQAVRAAHSGLMLPRSGGLLNRLTVFLNENGTIERHAVQPFPLTEARRAPLEDEQFAARMADRISGVLNLDTRLMGVVGFTYVEDAATRPTVSANNAQGFIEPRTVLVQYAWPRKPGEAGPSSPMAAPVQQSQQSLDRVTALRLVEHHLPDAFTNRSQAAGTPTLVLTPQGEVIRAGRVQYSSGVNHDTLVREQLMPGMQVRTFLSPTLTNAAGVSITVSFAWGTVSPVQ